LIIRRDRYHKNSVPKRKIGLKYFHHQEIKLVDGENIDMRKRRERLTNGKRCFSTNTKIPVGGRSLRWGEIPPGGDIHPTWGVISTPLMWVRG